MLLREGKENTDWVASQLHYHHPLWLTGISPTPVSFSLSIHQWETMGRLVDSKHFLPER